MNKIRYALDQNLSKSDNESFLYQKAIETKSYVYGYYKGMKRTKSLLLWVDGRIIDIKSKSRMI